MVSMPPRYDEHTYEFSSVEQKYVYTDAYSGYTLNQAPLPKSCLHTSSINFEPFSDNIYSNWGGVAMDEYYVADHHIIPEQYPSSYPFDTTATLYMTGYHAMEYEFNPAPPNHSQFLSGYATCAYLSPHDASSGAPSYPQTAWSPSEPSVASLSPPYESQWEEKDPAVGVECSLGDPDDEVLQGLGLYDCPELAADYTTPGEFYANCPSLGRGLKLEESFEYKEEDSDDDNTEDEDDDTEEDDDDDEN